MRRGYFIGKTTGGDYEVGRDPAAFNKLIGFPYAQLVTRLSQKFVERLWGVAGMKPGEVRRIRRHLGGITVHELTEREKEKFYGEVHK